ncbi:MAG: translocation/assembly module TamB domain-containing protein, partial [Bacteroidota bacterium]
NNAINKPFVVRRGGKIKWTGDPFNADIDIQAEYAGIRAPISGLISEYLDFASRDIQLEAENPTDVDLLMQLSGELMQPNIDFDLSFPRLQGNLRSYAENKVRTLKQDQSALNRQVFGLVTLGQFIPSELTVAQNPGGLINHTLSEVLENQLSIILTDLFSGIIEESKIISDLDIDLAYNRFDDTGSNPIDDPEDAILATEEYQFVGKARLFNDRWIVAYGPSIQRGTSANNTNSVYGHDAVIEYLISKDGRIKFRIANIHEPSIAGGSENRTSAGISYEREANTLKELISGKDKSSKKNIQNQSQ